MMQVLLAEADRTLADSIKFSLQREGLQVLPAFTGEAALQLWTKHHPHLVVLATDLPDLDGLVICRRIREQADTPIVLLSEQTGDEAVEFGLKLGADDYLTKPFSVRQLAARVQAVLRRAGHSKSPAQRQIGDLVFDPDRRAVRLGHHQTITLTRLECRLLDYLMLNAGRTLTAEAIMDHVWGADGSDRDTLRQLVRRLRAKIEPDSAQPTYIETVPSLGYGFNLPLSGRLV